MVYLLDRIDLEVLDFKNIGDFVDFSIWQTTEDRVKRLITNERCRSIFSKQEIVGLFGTKKMQMVSVKKIKLKLFDRCVVWTKTGKFFIVEPIAVTNVDNPIKTKNECKKSKTAKKLL